MTLDQEDITAIAAEVVRQLDLPSLAAEVVRLMRLAQDRKPDPEFLAYMANLP